MNELAADGIPVAVTCRVLKLARQPYYRWRATPVTDSGVAIARKAPHPHAAMLFVDFLMSKEGQVLYQELGYDSPRTDAEKASAGDRLERLYLTNRPNYIREYEDWAKLYQDVFVRRRI